MLTFFLLTPSPSVLMAFTGMMESLKADLTALDEQYDDDYEKIAGGK